MSQPQLPPPDPEPLPSRKYRVETIDQFRDSQTFYDPENHDAWIQTDIAVEVNQ